MIDQLATIDGPTGRASFGLDAVAAAWRFRIALALICVGAGLLSVMLGPDNYWDLRYYHLYAPWAYLHDRYLSHRFDFGHAGFGEHHHVSVAVDPDSPQVNPGIWHACLREVPGHAAVGARSAARLADHQTQVPQPGSSAVPLLLGVHVEPRQRLRACFTAVRLGLRLVQFGMPRITTKNLQSRGDGRRSAHVYLPSIQDRM
jgi:hypothetical protein